MLSGKNFFYVAPIEILREVFSYLAPEYLANLSTVNKKFYAAIHTNHFWQEKFKYHFPHHMKITIGVPKINWYGQFQYVYNNYDYKFLIPSEKKFFSLVKENDFESLKEIEISSVHLDITDISGRSTLDLAQQINAQQVLDIFYQSIKKTHTNSQGKINTEKKDAFGRTIFYWALELRQKNAEVQMLLAKGSKLGEKYFAMDIQPIHIVSREGAFEILKMFIENNPELYNQLDKRNQTPFMWAASRGYLLIMKYLLSKGEINLNHASQNCKDRYKNGRTALHWASYAGHYPVVDFLINAGADLSLRTVINREQAIHLAAIKGRLEVVKTLITHDLMFLNAYDKYGRTPLMLAALNDHKEIVEYLVSKPGVELENMSQGFNDPNRDGETALHSATMNGHSAIVKILIQAGAKIDHCFGPMKFPLIVLAAQAGHREVIQIFLERDSTRLEQKDILGQTALLWAAAKGHIEVVSFLISQGANVNVATYHPGRECHGKTPLYWAAQHGHNEIIDILLKNGAIVNANLSMNISKLTDEIRKRIEKLKDHDNDFNPISKLGFIPFYCKMTLFKSKSTSQNDYELKSLINSDLKLKSRPR